MDRPERRRLGDSGSQCTRDYKTAEAIGVVGEDAADEAIEQIARCNSHQI